MLISISTIIFTKSETEMLSSLEARTTLTFWPSRETKISLMRQKVDKYTTDKCLFDCDNKVTKGGGLTTDKDHYDESETKGSQIYKSGINTQ